MTKTTVYLDEELALAIRRMAESEGRSQADLIREALEDYTRRARRPRLRGIGKYRSGRRDIGKRAEKLLWKGREAR